MANVKARAICQAELEKPCSRNLCQITPHKTSRYQDINLPSLSKKTRIPGSIHMCCLLHLYDSIG